MIVEFEGRKHEFPDDAQPDEISKALAQVPKQEDVSAGMVLSGVPVAGAYVPQAEAALRAAFHPLTGVGSPGASYAERYAAELPKRQAQYKMAEEQSPWTATGAKALGAGLALAPLGAGAIGGRLLGAVGPMAARIPLGAASGGGIGVADALARGEDPYKAGAIGLVGGGVAPVVGQVAGAAAQGVRSWLPGAPSAAERLAGQMGRAGLAADDLTTPAALAARQAELGPQATASEFGENLRGLAQGMATQPGPARQAIYDTMTQRAAGARGRIDNDITRALGPRQDMALLTRGEQAARATEADPLYEAFRNTVVHPTAQIRQMVPVLERDGLLAEANRMMALEGRPAQTNFFVTGDRKTWPTTEAFDYVKQAIDGRIGTALRGGDRNMARIYKGVKDRLDNAVANSNPEAAQIWQQARQTWGNRTEILNAREAGQSAFTKGMRRDEMRQMLQGMGEPERAAFREGARDALAEMMDNSIRGDTNARQALLAPANREKLMMLGRNQASANLIRNMERELGFTDTLQRLIGNSQTASRQAMGAVTQPPAGGGALRQYLQQLDLGRPASWVPTRAGFDAAQTLQTGRQAARYENARQILARSLMQQGPAGEQSLLRLLNTRAPGRVDPLASRIGTIGAQGGIQGFADGGRYPDEPFLVGENGPEVIVPDRPGTVVPGPNGPMPSREEIQRYLRATTQDFPKIGPGGIPVNPEAFTAAVGGWPESSNVEDRRPERAAAEAQAAREAAAARTGRRGRQEGAGTRFVEGGYGIPSLYNMLDKGAQEAFAEGGKLQHYGPEYYNAGPVVAQALGAAGAPLVAPAMEGAVLGAGAIRRAAIPQVAKQELRAAEAPYPQYAEAYPPNVEGGVMKTDKKSGKPYRSRLTAPETDEFMATREKISEDMKGGYDPYYDPAKRTLVDPSKYPGRNVDTLTLKPARQSTIDTYLKDIDAPITRERLREAHRRGAELGNADNWYFMGQLEKDFVKELGPKEGRKAFLDRFASGLAATTSGQQPTSNYLMSHYLNYLEQTGKPMPKGAWEIPAPVSGQYMMNNVDDYMRMRREGGYAGLGENQPKMHNFARSFIGDLDRAVMDDQMAKGMLSHSADKNMANNARKTAFGLLEAPLHAEAAAAGLRPGAYQDVAWAGFKNPAGKPNVPGKPMISHINDAIERTHQLTGMPREEIVRRGIIRNEIPVYGFSAPMPTPFKTTEE